MFGDKVLVVAEGGSNHGGSLGAALALTDAAADAGAGAMKWQLWLSADEIYQRDTPEWESADKWRLPVEWLAALSARARERGMLFGLSSFGFPSLDEADKWVDFHKIASVESSWEPFVRAVAAKGKPVIVSVGMTDDFRRPLMWLGDEYADRTVLMQCTVSYPATLEDCDLFVLGQWHDPSDQGWGLNLVGLSDHTTHPTIAPCAAVALGARVIEKHLRLGRRCPLSHMGECPPMPPDWPHSIDPSQFREMVDAIRLTEKALGSSEKRIRESEKPYLRYRRGPRGLRGA